MKNRRRRLCRESNRCKREAAEGLNSGTVINLTDEELPPEVVAVLMKRSGFVPTNKYDSLKGRVDCYNAMSKLAVKTKRKLAPNTDEVNSQVDGESPVESLPPSLYRRKVGFPPTTNDHVVDSVVADVQELVCALNPPNQRSNLSALELKGLAWIQQRIRNQELVVSQADKGGALILAPYEFVQSLVLDKLADPTCYKCEGPDDCSPQYSHELFKLWTEGIEHEHVSPFFAKEVVGISEKFRPSTASVFKPGVPYFYPLLKVHKLKPEELRFGRTIPIRLVANLSDSVTSRSDKFLAWNFLKPLQKEFCNDLLGDSTQLLQWLEEHNDGRLRNKRVRCFALDFDSLYDSLNQSLVLEAVRAAIAECPCSNSWSEDKVNWICKLIQLSLTSSIAKFGNNWYRSLNGIPTGNSLSVMLANITVYYVLRKVIYSPEVKPPELIDLRRFIDDIGGMWSGSVRTFKVWADRINKQLEDEYGLSLKKDRDKAWDISDIGEFATFLDVRFKFDGEVGLVTDINIKATDARMYLHFSSCHPRHVFNSVVYSQALRYRRIINDSDTLKLRFAELKVAFKKSGYPEKLLNGVFDDVVKRQRNLSYQPKSSSPPFDVAWIATFGAGSPAISKIVKNTNSILQSSPAWRDVPKPISVVNRRDRNIGDIVLGRKKFALAGKGVNRGSTARCTPLGASSVGAPCQSCNMMAGVSSIRSHVSGRCFKTDGGNCKSRNVVYCAQCTDCSLQYVGQTTQELRARINNHRAASSGSKHYRKGIGCSSGRVVQDLDSDDKALVDHMVSVHGNNNFNAMYRFTVCEKDVSPRSLDFAEQSWIAKLQTMRPEGINIANPCGVRQDLVTRVLHDL